MTREEEINIAAQCTRIDIALKLSHYTDSIDKIDDIKEKLSFDEIAEGAFIEGVRWSDENPKSPWISVKDDLPSFHSDLVENAIATKNVIVLLNDGRIRETQLLCGHWKEYDKKVTHWMPIPELPKE